MTHNQLTNSVRSDKNRQYSPGVLWLEILIFSLFFFLPVGWSKHWLVSSSLVNGVLVDYLMPDLWFQDILALATLLTVSFLLKFWQRKSWRVNTKIILGFLLVVVSILRSTIPLISLISAARFFLAFLTAFSLKSLFQKKPELVKLAYQGLIGALIWTSILAFGQLIHQGTVFGWWFLGEPIFGPGSGGVKKINLLGKTLVTPLATFPHSNILAAFALLSLLIFLQRVNTRRKQATIALSLGLLLFSFSFYTWLIALGIFILMTKKKRPRTTLFLSLVFLLSLVSSFYLIPTPSVFRRFSLARIALRMVADHPFWGVGWGCFVKRLPDYWQQLNLTNRFLQPVHNIFLIVLSELGLLGGLGLLMLIINSSRKLLRECCSRSWLFLAIFLLSLFDHYFWTTTPGVYLLFLLPALAKFSKTKTRAG